MTEQEKDQFIKLSFDEKIEFIEWNFGEKTVDEMMLYETPRWWN
jgi:hypothetical protein